MFTSLDKPAIIIEFLSHHQNLQTDSQARDHIASSWCLLNRGTFAGRSS